MVPNLDCRTTNKSQDQQRIPLLVKQQSKKVNLDLKLKLIPLPYSTINSPIMPDI